jgi:hypothetical protein
MPGYLLIDGASEPQLMARLYRRREPLNIEPLYLGTRFQDIQQLGPVLVEACEQSTLLQEWEQSDEWQAQSCMLFSRAPLLSVADHLRRFTSPATCNGSSLLLRFADPLVMYHWLSSYDDEARRGVLGPVTHVRVKTPVHCWQTPCGSTITPFIRRGSEAAWSPAFGVLGEQQLMTLERAYRWRLKERFYTWLNQRNPGYLDPDQADDWLEQVLERGMAWGLVSERALVIWAEFCVDWGLDFLTRMDSPYHAWLRLDPEHARLPPELRIMAMDEYRKQQRLLKERTHG